jgi:putative tributyrin esterase
MLASAALLGLLALSPLIARTHAAPIARGSLEELSVRSAALDRHVRALVYLPPGYAASTERYPVVYLLHGTPGTPDGIVDLGLRDALDEGAASGRIRRLIVVIPSGGDRRDSDTEWADSIVDPGERWGSFVAHDLVSAIDARYRTLARRSDRAVAGLSMGGFGALNLALRHRNTFGAASSWSGYMLGNTPEVEGTSGSASWRRASPLEYVAGLTPSLRAKPIGLSFYTGRSDRFLSENEDFNALLGRLRVPHRFAIYAGGHSASLWRRELRPELRWLSTQMAR